VPVIATTKESRWEKQRLKGGGEHGNKWVVVKERGLSKARGTMARNREWQASTIAGYLL
jgi:hypothetical protein